MPELSDMEIVQTNVQCALCVGERVMVWRCFENDGCWGSNGRLAAARVLQRSEDHNGCATQAGWCSANVRVVKFEYVRLCRMTESRSDEVH